MVNILTDIINTKRVEIATNMAILPMDKMVENAMTITREYRDFAGLFDKNNKVLIAEIKPKSPSLGDIIFNSPFEIAKCYAHSDADAISVLTDNTYFGGSLELLRQIKKIVPQPILRKDFIIDTYQVYESALIGADAFLLIATILSVSQLRELRELGESLKMNALVETHNEDEIMKAIESRAKIIGINNRNLDTLAIDLRVTESLTSFVPTNIPIVSESGIFDKNDVARVGYAGARGILVGTSILQSADPIAKIAELKHALTI